LRNIDDDQKKVLEEQAASGATRLNTVALTKLRQAYGLDWRPRSRTGCYGTPLSTPPSNAIMKEPSIY